MLSDLGYGRRTLSRVTAHAACCKVSTGSCRIFLLPNFLFSFLFFLSGLHWSVDQSAVGQFHIFFLPSCLPTRLPVRLPARVLALACFLPSLRPSLLPSPSPFLFTSLSPSLPLSLSPLPLHLSSSLFPPPFSPFTSSFPSSYPFLAPYVPPCRSRSRPCHPPSFFPPRRPIHSCAHTEIGFLLPYLLFFSSIS